MFKRKKRLSSNRKTNLKATSIKLQIIKRTPKWKKSLAKIIPKPELKNSWTLQKKGQLLCWWFVIGNCMPRAWWNFWFSNYDSDLTDIIHEVTKNNKILVCRKCHGYLQKFHVPVQIFEPPPKNVYTNRLEWISITTRICLKQ